MAFVLHNTFGVVSEFCATINCIYYRKVILALSFALFLKDIKPTEFPLFSDSVLGPCILFKYSASLSEVGGTCWLHQNLTEGALTQHF